MQSPQKSSLTPKVEAEQDRIESKTAVVIGAAGFIGRHLVEELKAQRYKVISADRLPDPGQPNPTVVDVTDDDSLERLRQSYGRIDLVVNLAGLIRGEPEAMRAVNARAPLQIESRFSNSVLVSLGSAAEYGVPQEDPVSERHPCDPVSLYGKTKWEATRQRRRMIVVRPSSVIGSGMASTNLVGHILSSLKKGQRRIAISSLSVVRDYLSAKDCARGIRLAAERGAQGAIYNMGSGIPTSVAQLKSTIQMVSGLDFDLYEQTRPDEIVRFVLDPGKAQAELGFEAHDNLETMIRAAWEAMEA